MNSRRLRSSVLVSLGMCSVAACGPAKPPNATVAPPSSAAPEASGANYRWKPNLDAPGFECPLDLPRGCDADSPDACEAALPKLQDECSRRLPCACVKLGHLLTHGRPRRHFEGIIMLDAACVLGVDDACNSATRFAARCVKSASPACDFLTRLGRVPLGEQQPRATWDKTGPTPEQVGCYRTKEDDAYSSSPLVSPPRAFCIDPGTVSFQASEWDTTKVIWERLQGTKMLRATTTEGGEFLTSDTESMTFEGLRLQLARMSPEETAATRAELAKLGDPDAVCAHHTRCERAIRPGERGAGRLPRSLRECAARERDVKAHFLRQNPKRPLPPECR